MTKRPRILCINPRGPGDLHGLRARCLGSRLDADLTFYDVDRTVSRMAAGRHVWNILRSEKWDLVYQEGTGIAGGLNLIRAARAWGQPYVVSSGDPIGGYFRVTKGPLAGWVFEQYEKQLYRHCAGFIGWTPYLAGMAIKMGARRAVTIEGAVDLDTFHPASAEECAEAKRRFGIDPAHIACGVVGSLQWTTRQSYCYGLELVEMLKRLCREDVSILIVGEGDGRERLEQAVPETLRNRAVFTGRLPQERVVCAMQAMDIGFVTQTLDELGSYRLTTKLPEYLACGVPVAMSPIPGFYDYVMNAGWALPARHPAHPAFHAECAVWVDSLSRDEIAIKAGRARETAARRFDYGEIGDRFRAFVEGLLGKQPGVGPTQSQVGGA